VVTGFPKKIMLKVKNLERDGDLSPSHRAPVA
jgi:hypothetical protein